MFVDTSDIRIPPLGQMEGCTDTECPTGLEMSAKLKYLLLSYAEERKIRRFESGMTKTNTTMWQKSPTCQ